MGIYIAEEAPKGCLGCKLHNYLGVYAQCFWTKTIIDEFTYDGDPQNPTRPDDCPLHSVAQHGRLIDTDGQTFPTAHRNPTNDYMKGWNACLRSVQQQPTIISAKEDK